MTLQPAERLAAIGAVAAAGSLLLPWYGIELELFGGFSQTGPGGVQLRPRRCVGERPRGTVALIWLCAGGYRLPRPLGEGMLLVAAGVWIAMVVAYLAIDRPDEIAGFERVRLRYGAFVALGGAAALVVGGIRLRLVRPAACRHRGLDRSRAGNDPTIRRPRASVTPQRRAQLDGRIRERGASRAPRFLSTKGGALQAPRLWLRRCPAGRPRPPRGYVLLRVDRALNRARSHPAVFPERDPPVMPTSPSAPGGAAATQTALDWTFVLPLERDDQAAVVLMGEQLDRGSGIAQRNSSTSSLGSKPPPSGRHRK